MNFDDLLNKVKNLPYGRNTNRHDFSLVLTESKGTCSSKHAFLKDYANKNQIKNVKLYIGIFKMNEINTPKLGDLLSKHKIEYIPEAHCYLKINQIPVDVTTSESFYEKIKYDIMEEIEILSSQVSTFKVDYHKAYIKNWIKESNQKKTFEEIWNLREQCISKLAE